MTATDADWAAGEGNAVNGPIEALVLAMTGRPTGLEELQGDGMALVHQRVELDASEVQRNPDADDNAPERLRSETPPPRKGHSYWTTRCDKYASMTITRETRYGGVYEGGRWAAFDVEEWDDIPGEAFGGHVAAPEWWWEGPSVVVTVGDSAEEAENRLVRRTGTWDQAEYPVGSRICIA